MQRKYATNICNENMQRKYATKIRYARTCFQWDYNCTFYQICVVVYRLSQVHFNSKPHQTLGSYCESFVDISYQIWWPYHSDKIVFKWLQNLRKWGNFTYRKSVVIHMTSSQSYYDVICIAISYTSAVYI